MTRLTLFLLLGVLMTFSSAAMAGHKTQHGGHGKHHNSQHGHQYKHHNRHHNRHHDRHYRHYGHGHYQPPALFSFSYSSHGAAINYRSSPPNGYLYGSVHLHGR